MKLVMYSGGPLHKNREMDQQLLRVIGKARARVTYIPSSCGHGESYFPEFVRHYSKYDFACIQYFPVDLPFSNQASERIQRSDVIFLSGGNTYHFLKHLRMTGFLQELKNFVKRGGVLVGQSAGSIMMTPTIGCAEFPWFDRDDNEVNLKDKRSMNLVNFEFFPHYCNTKKYNEELERYSRRLKAPVIAAPDASGVVVLGGSRSLIGRCSVFSRGQKIAF